VRGQPPEERLRPIGRYSSADDFELPDAQTNGGRVSLGTLLAGPLLVETCALWLIFLTNMFTIYTFFSWSPVILSSFNLPLAIAVRGSLVFNLAGVCGGTLMAWLISRAGSRWPTVALAVLGSVTLFGISQVLSHAANTHSLIDLTTLMSAIAIVGFVMIGIQTAAFRLSTYLYPTPLRAAGVGWAAGFGRVGGILSSLIAGWILVQVHGSGLFATLACVVIATLVGSLLIRRHLPAISRV
jgi:AAHS family 4-hydroxybenzoate transporter-like MFS transporter